MTKCYFVINAIADIIFIVLELKRYHQVSKIYVQSINYYVGIVTQCIICCVKKIGSVCCRKCLLPSRVYFCFKGNDVSAFIFVFFMQISSWYAFVQVNGLPYGLEISVYSEPVYFHHFLTLFLGIRVRNMKEKFYHDNGR